MAGTKLRTGYMCMTDFLYELGEAVGGAIVYSSEEEARKFAPCVTECGLVEVKVAAVDTIISTKYELESNWGSSKEYKEYLKRRIETYRDAVILYETELFQLFGEWHDENDSTEEK